MDSNIPATTADTRDKGRELQFGATPRDVKPLAPVDADKIAAQPFLASRSPGLRVPAIDWMRGLVMILMATDHASGAFNANKPHTDSAMFYDPTQPLSALEFSFRWLSHICAPTFLFLAGTSLALSINRKKHRGATAWAIDRDLLIRGLIIVGIELTFINYFWVPNALLLQVMYAIGVSFVLMIPARRLPPVFLGVLAIGVLVVTEFARAEQTNVTHDPVSLLRALFFSAGWIECPDSWGPSFTPTGAMNGIFVGYPALPWWSMMALGWVFGLYLLRVRDRSESREATKGSPARVMFLSGMVSLIVFAVLRGFNGFGNLGLYRTDQSWVQWLHVSKYPPSLTYAGLELGLMCLILAAMFRWQTARPDRASPRNPFLVFGQTAFFFYLAHIALLQISSRLLHMNRQAGLKEAIIASVVVLLVLYPVCIWYRSLKTRHARSLLRYF